MFGIEVMRLRVSRRDGTGDDTDGRILANGMGIKR